MSNPTDRITPIVRKPEFGFDETTPNNWYAGKTHLSNFFDSFSIGITPMEGFIIRVLRNIQKNHGQKIQECDDLAREVEAFVGQETQHSFAHNRFNKLLASRGYPVKELSDWCSEHIKTWNINHSEQEQLATVVAMESFLGDIGDVVLSKSQYRDDMDPSVRGLFAWHFYEEFEHQAVSYDLYTAIYGKGISAYFTRIRMYVKATVKSAQQIAVPLIRLLKHNDENTLKAWLSLINFLFINPGFYRGLMLRYFRFFNPAYHPWKDQEYASKIERLKSEIVT